MAATGFHSKSILSASTNNFRSWKLGERERVRERGERKRKILIGIIRSLDDIFSTTRIVKKDSLGSRFWFLDRRRAIYGGEMKETGESLDLEQRSGETLADARHGSR